LFNKFWWVVNFFGGAMNISGIDGATWGALSQALDAAVIRQQVFANNIANANTAGFVPQRVSFSSIVDMENRAVGASSVQLVPQFGLSADGAVHLDSEVAAMAQNGAHYQALLRLLNRQFSVMTSAVSEGKR